MSRNNVTFQDIAAYTGFSKTTISRYFNKPDSVTPANRRKIQAALDELGYTSNKVAQILATGQTEFMGLILPNFYHQFYAEVLNQFLRSYEKYGYKFIVFGGGSSEESERRYVNELLAYHVEGLILLSHTIPSSEFSSYDIPVVAVEREDYYIDSVRTDNYEGGILATDHLMSRNCDIYLHINLGGDDPRVPATMRTAGFRAVCERHGLRHEVLNYESETDYADLNRKINYIIEEIDQRYTGMRKGIFCSSDTIAIIILNHLIRKYGKLPDDYKLVGFDGASLSDQAILPITTVEQQIDQLVDGAMEILLSRIAEQSASDHVPHFEPIHRTITPKLLVRSTT